MACVDQFTKQVRERYWIGMKIALYKLSVNIISDFNFFGSYRVHSLYHCRLCALSVAITFPFTLRIIIIVLVSSTYPQMVLVVTRTTLTRGSPVGEGGGESSVRR